MINRSAETLNPTLLRCISKMHSRGGSMAKKGEQSRP